MTRNTDAEAVRAIFPNDVKIDRVVVRSHGQTTFRMNIWINASSVAPLHDVRLENTLVLNLFSAPPACQMRPRYLLMGRMRQPTC